MKRLLRISLAIILFTNLSVADQSDVIAPGDSLVADGIPKIPASLAHMGIHTTMRYFPAPEEGKRRVVEAAAKSRVKSNPATS